jgi:hypothetical protein
MQHEEVIFQGSRSNINELLIALGSVEEVSSAQVLSIESAAVFLGREPLNQSELVDILVNITVNLVSAAIYDQVRQKIDTQAKKKGFNRKSGGRSDSTR